MASAQGNDAAQCDPTDSTLTGGELKIYKEHFSSVFGTSGAAISFDRDSVDKLCQMDSANTFVRLYFGAKHDTLGHLPFVIMVPFKKTNCANDITSTVLVSQSNGDSSVFMNGESDEVQNALTQWRGLYNLDSLAGYSQRWGYRFTWTTVFDACVEDTNDLHVSFAIMNDTTYNDTGFVDSLSIHMVLSDKSVEDPRTGTGDRLFLDFSEPCPKLCGSLVTGSSTRQSAIKEEED
ncbi:MAG: hypothetical protein Crog4KO_18020 [Crocinitomicaceae bacterium]